METPKIISKRVNRADVIKSLIERGLLTTPFGADKTKNFHRSTVQERLNDPLVQVN